ncbi:ubiquinol oxidase subunit II [Paenibacillus ginsengihumi]|uniref:ubiquinol oxidase subunit II n=1 Tax=Paenibacillus ginsengihumi TaxID=431596 RepID=UPI000367487A
MKQKPAFMRLTALLTLLLMSAALAGCSDQLIVLDPKGPIGEVQRDLIVISTLLCLIVVVPVLLLAAFIVWRYRDKPGRSATYKPDWEHSTKLEAIWWGIPILIIIALGSVTVHYTYKLEPSRPIESAKEPITIQVTSLDWKWMFKYPEQGIATVNYVQIPEGVPVKFQLTSDAPMNSFWIPQLGGQMYSMSGMAMTLYLQADEQGEYIGMGSNFSGKDFGQMRFNVKATSQEQFDEWVQEVKLSAPALTMEGYEKLAEPGVSNPQAFSSFPEGLFDRIVTKYAVGGHAHGGHSHGGAAAPEKGADAGRNADQAADGHSSGHTGAGAHSRH